MIVTSNAELTRLAIHKVGNKTNDEDVIFSDSEIQVNDSIKSLLLTYFLTPFKGEDYYNLFHETDINLNEVYTYVREIFEYPNSLFDQSIKLAKHLYEKSTHQKINGGEFYVTYLKNCIIAGEEVDAIGLFKSESKDTFLKIYPENENFSIDSEFGININKLDKGCLIFNTEGEEGYMCAIVDSLSRSKAIYWKDDFLKVVERSDSYHNTQNAIQICADYIKKQMPKDFEIEKVDQIDLLNKTSEYLQNNDRFDFNNFSEEVIRDPQAITAFKEYKENYEEERDIEIPEKFRISENAAKKSKAIMKSIIKLDKNFHIYIHGRRDYISKEYDKEKEMSYYKIFFTEET